MKNRILNIVLVFITGGDFVFRDLALLATRIHQTNKNVQITCLTDHVSSPVSMVGMDLIPVDPVWKGWWGKMNLFSPELVNLRPFLYLDLDTAILGDVKELIPTNEDDFVGLRDFYYSNRFASGVMWIPNSPKIAKIWKVWNEANYKSITSRYHGDQDFIGSVVKADTYFQDYTDTISSFKPLPIYQWLDPVPKEIKVVCFHGKPRIFKAATIIKWVDNYISIGA